MCERCNLLSGDKRILEDHGEIEVSMNRTNKNYYISVENDNDYIEVDINYCPMCGRKLKEN